MSNVKAVKSVNYSDDTIATMKAMYTGKDNKKDVAAIAAKIGKTAGSVRAKLSNLGVYEVEKKGTTKSGAGTTKKVDLVERIAGAVGGLSEAEQDGLVKATASPLAKILNQLTTRPPRDSLMAMVDEIDLEIMAKEEAEKAEKEAADNKDSE